MPGLDFYWNIYMLLDSGRTERGAIPHWTVQMYVKENKISKYMAQRLYFFVASLDQFYMEFMDKKSRDKKPSKRGGGTSKKLGK